MTNRDEKLSLRQQILDILATGWFNTRQVTDQLGVQTRVEAKKVYNTILELARDGRVASLVGGRGKVWYRSGPQKVWVQQKIWRAACLKSQKGHPFTIADLVAITPGAAQPKAVSKDYAKRYVRFLEEGKYLVRLGRRGSAIAYTVAPGKEKEPAPRWNRRAERRARQVSGARGQGSGKPLKVAALEANCSRLGRGACVGYWEECAGCEVIQSHGLQMARRVLAEMSQKLSALTGEIAAVNGLLGEMTAVVAAAAAKEAGHGAEGADQP